MPLDMLITGRIATLAGDHGLRLGRGDRHPRRPGRVRRVGGGPRDARRPVHRADRPRARRGRDPGHHRRASPPRRRRRRPPARRPERRGDARRGPRPDRPAPIARRRTPTPGSRVTAGTRTAGAAGRPRPTSRPWRPVVAAPSGRTTTTRCSPVARPSPRPAIDRDTPDPPGGVIGRDRDGDPDGMLFEMATRRVIVLIPPMSTDDLEAAIVATSRELLALGVVAAHDPGRRRPTRTSRGPIPPTPACPSEGRCRSGSSPRSGTTASRPRSRAACAAATSSAPTRPVVPASAGRRRSPTARSGRGPRRCSPTSSPSPTGRFPRSCGAASGSPGARPCASWSIAPRRAASRPRSTRSATPRSGPRSTR